MKLLPTTLALLVLLLASSYLEAGKVFVDPVVCDKKCQVRCSKASIKDRCLFNCGVCCRDCEGCVPSGTYGNKDECPCYRDKLASNSKKHKCP